MVTSQSRDVVSDSVVAVTLRLQVVDAMVMHDVCCPPAVEISVPLLAHRLRFLAHFGARLGLQHAQQVGGPQPVHFAVVEPFVNSLHPSDGGFVAVVVVYVLQAAFGQALMKWQLTSGLRLSVYAQHGGEQG